MRVPPFAVPDTPAVYTGYNVKGRSEKEKASRHGAHSQGLEPGMQGEAGTSLVLERIFGGDCRRVMFVGPVDTGKTFLALSVADRMCAEGRHVAFLDFDLGQSTVGPPGCVGLQVPWVSGERPLFPTAMVFLGFSSPAYDVASVVEAGLRLEKRAVESGCKTLLIDTSGMVEGGLAALLKRRKIRALRPDLVVVLDRHGEALHIFRGLEETAYGEMVLVKAAAEAVRKSREERAAYRRERLREYFRSSRELEVNLTQLAIIATSTRLAASAVALREGCLLGLNDAEGYTMALARVLEVHGKRARLLTPFPGGDEDMASLAVGPALLDDDGSLRLLRT